MEDLSLKRDLHIMLVLVRAYYSIGGAKLLQLPPYSVYEANSGVIRNFLCAGRGYKVFFQI